MQRQLKGDDAFVKDFPARNQSSAGPGAYIANERALWEPDGPSEEMLLLFPREHADSPSEKVPKGEWTAA